MHPILNYFKSKKQFHIKAFGSSMFPLFLPDDILYFKKTTFSRLRVNDVILVYKSNRSFTHRIIYKGERYLVTKGDNNLSSDGKIYSHQIIGKAYQLKRNGQIINLDTHYLLQSTQYFQEIVKIKQAFEKNKINYIFLKGLPLYLYFDKSHPRRIYADCDVLIDKNNWEKASKILEKFNYRKAETSYSKIHQILKDKPTELVYFKNINDFPVILDIHVEAGFLMNQLGRLDALYSQESINDLSNDFLKEKRMAKIQTESFPILSPTNLIIYLALHFFHHNFRGVFRLELLDKVIRRYPITHITSQKIVDKLLSYRLQNFIYPVFLFLRKYYHSALPNSFMSSIKPDKTRLTYIKKNILNINIFDDETRIVAGMNRFKNLFFLSPNPLWKKLLIIFNIQVIYSLFWVMIFFCKRSFKRSFRSI